MAKQHHAPDYHDRYYQPQPNPLAALFSAFCWLVVFGLVGLIVYLAWPQIVAQYRGAPAERAPLAAPAVAPSAPIVVPATPLPPQPAPVVLPVQDSQPAPVVQPPAPPAQDAPAAPAPVVIIHRVEQSGAQVVTGSGACATARTVARRCGK